MTFWTAGAGWMAQFYYDYYLYTGDRAFLRDRALPFMKEAALFYEDFLIEGPDGKLLFSPTYSPENIPATVRFAGLHQCHDGHRRRQGTARRNLHRRLRGPSSTDPDGHQTLACHAGEDARLS